MSYATFIMSQVIPQCAQCQPEGLEPAGDLLAATWWRRSTGGCTSSPVPPATGGRGKNGFATDIADGKVVVPALCWKIVVVLDGDGGDNDLAKVTKDTRVIAVVMPNDNAVGYHWDEYRTSVREIEKKTKLSFFDKLPSEVAQALKEEVDDAKIPPPAIARRRQRLRTAYIRKRGKPCPTPS